ncbi:MAG TPA: carbohydrate kinase family protein [Longilinea sp.]|nr:carbohydrate kinase family protein [Longilinea sp.]
MNRDVIVIGPLNIDLLLNGSAPTNLEELQSWSGPSTVTLCAAGSAGYIAQDLAKFGLSTAVVSTIADDPFGDSLLRILAEGGLDISGVNRQADTETAIGIYMLLFGSKKRPLTYRMPTHDPWPRHFSEDHIRLMQSARHIHCAGYLHFPDMYSGEMAEIFHQAKTRGQTTSLDPQFPLLPITGSWMEPIREILVNTDILMVDETEARQITGEEDLSLAGKRLLSAGAGVVAVKQGAGGSLFFTPGSNFFQPPVKVPDNEIVESIGAGDAYDTGLIYGFLKGWDWPLCLRFATAAAASTLRGSGGTLSLASADVIETQARTM